MILNFIFFQIIWFGCIVLGNVFIPVALVLILIHFNHADSTEHDMHIMLLAGGIGFALDSALMHLGVMRFESGLISDFFIPPWLIMLWVAFAMTLNHSLYYFQEKPLFAFIGGAVSGPLSYLAGERFGAVQFGYDTLTTAIIFACLWGPLFWALTQYMRSMNEAMYEKPHLSKKETQNKQSIVAEESSCLQK